MILTDLLKHDKVLTKKPPAPHLRNVPEYLVDPTTQEASKVVKLARAAMGNTNANGHHRSKKTFRRNKDPLKTFSAEVILDFPPRLFLFSYGNFPDKLYVR